MVKRIQPPFTCSKSFVAIIEQLVKSVLHQEVRVTSMIILAQRFKCKSHQPAVSVPVVATYTYGPTTSNEINVKLDCRLANIMLKVNMIFRPKN